MQGVLRLHNAEQEHCQQMQACSMLAGSPLASRLLTVCRPWAAAPPKTANALGEVAEWSLPCLHTPVITLPAGGLPYPSADDITGTHLAFWGRCSVQLSGGPTGSPALCSKAGHAVQGGCRRPRHPGCRTRTRRQTPGPGAQQPPRCWPSLTARCRAADEPAQTSPASQ